MTQGAFGAAVDALAQRDLSAAELDRRLARAGFDAGARVDAIERAAASGYLDDERVARERARVLADRNASDAAIRSDLTRRGVPGEMAEAALAAVDPEAERAARLAKRLGGGPRAARALLRKGFPEDLVERTVDLEIAE